MLCFLCATKGVSIVIVMSLAFFYFEGAAHFFKVPSCHCNKSQLLGYRYVEPHLIKVFFVTTQAVVH